MANGIEGLLGSPIFNIGAGLLSAAGPSMQPVGLGQGLLQGIGMAQRGQALQLRNQATRQALQAQARQQQALQQLPGLLGEGPQAEALGLLGQIAPEALAQGLINQALPSERAAPADARMMEALGIPLTPEGFEQFQKMQGSDLEDLVARSQLHNAELQRLLTMERVQRERRERETEERTETQELIGAKNRLSHGVRQTQEIVSLAQELRGTPLEAGAFQGAREMGAGLAALAGVEGAGDMLAKSQRLRQLAVNAGVASLEVLRGLGRLTGKEFEVLVGNAVNPETHTTVILQSAADNFEGILAEADKLDISLEERAQIEQLIPFLRNPTGRSMAFPSEQAANAALDSGLIKIGDVIEINGKRVRVEE